MIWIVAHDAGGAEILSSWIIREKWTHEFACVLDGPALKIFRSKLGPKLVEKSLTEFKALLRSTDQVVTGSGIASNLEIDAIRIGKERRALVSTWIDHWINYPQRFTRNGELFLPDEIWVSDSFQEKKVQLEIGSIPTMIRENPYFAELKDLWHTFPKRERAQDGRLHWLFMGEAWSEIRPELMKLPALQRPELICFRRFLELVKSVGFSNSLVRIRPHPAEIKDKYLEALKSIEVDWEWSPGDAVIQDCAWADEVVGMGSMGLVVAILGGKSTTSIGPDSSWERTIPLAELRKI